MYKKSNIDIQYSMLRKNFKLDFNGMESTVLKVLAFIEFNSSPVLTYHVYPICPIHHVHAYL